jgi:hypothetical protein
MYDLHFTDAQRFYGDPNEHQPEVLQIHEFNLPNNVPLPNWFDPVLPTMTFNTKQQPIKWNIPADVAMPADTNQLAFYSIAQLSSC